MKSRRRGAATNSSDGDGVIGNVAGSAGNDNDEHKQQSCLVHRHLLIWAHIKKRLAILLCFIGFYFISSDDLSGAMWMNPSQDDTYSDTSATAMTTTQSTDKQEERIAATSIMQTTSDSTSSSPPNHGQIISAEPSPIIVVAYAISIVKCSDMQTTSAGLIDAAIVLKHSVHLTSVHNPDSGSRYSYKMYAITHTNAVKCARRLEPFGFELIIRDSPVRQDQIKGEFLRKNIHKEYCCGADEFIKLYAYTIHDHPIVVHTDIDFAFMQPMDELFDAMMFDYESPEGIDAREKISADHGVESSSMPSDIQAFITKDWHQVIPGRKAAFQAGFMVAKPNQDVFNKYIEVILEGDYVQGYGHDNGWGGKGYGVVVGSMAMQGIGAYFYDVIQPGISVDLNGCRYNHMGCTVRYVDHPNFMRNRKDIYNRCRNNREECEDCTKTSLDMIKNVHYTCCRKPWNCTGRSQPSDERGIKGINHRSFEHCLPLVRRWHEIRYDFEDKWYEVTKDEQVLEGRVGKHRPDIFMGHCNGETGSNYIQLKDTIASDVMKQIHVK